MVYGFAGRRKNRCRCAALVEACSGAVRSYVLARVRCAEEGLSRTVAVRIGSRTLILPKRD